MRKMKKTVISWIVFAVSLFLVVGTSNAQSLVRYHEWFEGNYSVSPAGVRLDAQTANGDEDAYYGFSFTAEASRLHVHYDYLLDMNVAWEATPPDYLWTDAIMYLDEGGGWSSRDGSVFMGWWESFRYDWPSVPEGPYSNARHYEGTSDEYYNIEVGRAYDCCLGVWADVYGMDDYSASAHAGISNFQVDYAPVPLPGAVWLLGSGLVGLVGFGRRFRS
ncbi:MAG: hypothetical protein V1736_06800 [Pseudomonadota bacterium]